MNIVKTKIVQGRTVYLERFFSKYLIVSTMPSHNNRKELPTHVIKTQGNYREMASAFHNFEKLYELKSNGYDMMFQEKSALA